MINADYNIIEQTEKEINYTTMYKATKFKRPVIAFVTFVT